MTNSHAVSVLNCTLQKNNFLNVTCILKILLVAVVLLFVIYILMVVKYCKWICNYLKILQLFMNISIQLFFVSLSWLGNSIHAFSVIWTGYLRNTNKIFFLATFHLMVIGPDFLGEANHFTNARLQAALSLWLLSYWALHKRTVLSASRSL